MKRHPDSIVEIEGAIRNCRAFASASDDSISQLARDARLVHVPKSGRLAAEGEPAAHLIVVGSGRFRMVQSTADGREVLVEGAEKGECISAPAALAASRHRGDIVAAVESAAVLIPITRLWQAVEADSALAAALLRTISAEMLGLTDLIKGYSLDVNARLAGRLFHLALESGKSVRGGLGFDLEIRKAELAAELGVAPETLSRAFKKLTDLDLVTIRGTSVTIHDLKSLAALASGFGL